MGKVVEQIGLERVVVATSSSLLHTPVTLANESKLSAEVKDWFSFATEKCYEVAAIAKAVAGKAEDVKEYLEKNKASISARREFEKKSDASVRERLSAVKEEMYERKGKFPNRIAAQQKKVALPSSPPPPSAPSPRPRRSDRPVQSSQRVTSARRSTTSSSLPRSSTPSGSRKRLASMSSSTANPSVTTWSSTLARSSRDSSSPRTPGSSPTAPATSDPPSSSLTSPDPSR